MLVTAQLSRPNFPDLQHFRFKKLTCLQSVYQIHKVFRFYFRKITYHQRTDLRLSIIRHSEVDSNRIRQRVN